MHNTIGLNSELDSFSVAKVHNCKIDEILNQVSISKFTLKVLTQNIRSINCNIDNFSTLLQRSSLEWDVLVLSECWLTSSRVIPTIENYSYITTTSHKTQNEGVVIYYKKHLKVSFEEPNLSDANALLLIINKDTCILGIYRPPSHSNASNFICSLDSTLSKLSKFKNFILCGDININIVAGSVDRRSYEYLNILASHGILPGHTLPTHGTSCLDHIMIRTKSDADCFVFETSITDHESVAICFSYDVDNNNSLHRLVQQTCFEKLDSLILNLDFRAVLDCDDDVNTAVNLLIDQLVSAINESTQIKKISNRKRTLKPWITIGLLKCMKNRDQLYIKYKSNPNSDIAKVTYKRYRNFCKSLLKKAKFEYEKQELMNAKDNKKQLWEVIKNITGSSKKKVDFSTCLLSSDNPGSSIDNVNCYFTNVGKELAEQILSQGHLDGSNATEDNSVSLLKSFAMLPTDEDEVTVLIKALKDKCAVGIDQISGKFLKRYISCLGKPITHICNLDISTGVFPCAFKRAVIKPIYKGGVKSCATNFRPISILPTMSKILERIINKRLVLYLETNNLLASSQYGFRRAKSTNDAVHDLVDSIIRNIDDKQKCVVIFIDLAKAFDTVFHPHLLDKLQKLGVRGLPLKLLENYLQDRKQQVKIGDKISGCQTVNYGVPQGSILGPTLFLVYINELCQQKLVNGKILSYADDTALFFSSNTWEEVFHLAQLGFNKVSSWLHSNLLSLNVSKTQYLAFAHRSNLLPSSDFKLIAHCCSNNNINSNVICDCPVLLKSKNIKYLGVVIDQTLSFRPQIDTLVGRLRKLIYIFKALKHVADIHVKKMVYYALAQSIIDYCITSWGGVAKCHLLEAERAQRAILKVGAGLPFRFDTDKLFKKWDVLTVRQRYILNTVLLKHSTLEYLPEMYKNKRKKYKVCQPLPFHSRHTNNFFCFQGNFLYNRINKSVKMYSLNKYECKHKVIKFIKSLNYEKTEALLIPDA